MYMMYADYMLTRPKGAYWQRESEYIIIACIQEMQLYISKSYLNDSDSTI